jgi:hypothetical protein
VRSNYHDPSEVTDHVMYRQVCRHSDIAIAQSLKMTAISRRVGEASNSSDAATITWVPSTVASSRENASPVLPKSVSRPHLGWRRYGSSLQLLRSGVSDTSANRSCQRIVLACRLEQLQRISTSKRHGIVLYFVNLWTS